MYTAPVDKTIFQTFILALLGWWVYTFLYKPVVYGPDPLTFTTDEVIRIIQTSMNEFYDECSRTNYSIHAITPNIIQPSRELEDKFTNTQNQYHPDIDNDNDMVTTLLSLKHIRPA